MKITRLICLLLAVNAAAADFESLWQSNRWFELREATLAGGAAPFYRGAVAAAFGPAKSAEQALKLTFTSDPNTVHQSVAAGYLAALYNRLGRYREAALWHSRMSTPKGQSQSLLEALSRLPDQRVTHRGPSHLTCAHDPSVVAIPVEISKHTGCYSLDTSSAFSSMSDAEARRTGLQIQPEALDLNGIAVHIGLARELKAGQVRIRNAAFVVFPAGSPVFDTEPAILGIPALLALETIRWTAAGAVDLGFPSTPAEPNLYFNWMLPVIGIDLPGVRVALQLDTGSDDTFLWPEFGRAFPAVAMLAGAQGHYRQLGLFGATDVVFWPVPELQLAIGGAPLTLHNVKLLYTAAQKNCFWCYGNLGADVAHETGAVTLDFGAMRLTVGQSRVP